MIRVLVMVSLCSCSDVILVNHQSDIETSITTDTETSNTADTEDPMPLRVTLIGDSNMENSYLPDSETWASLLANDLGVSVANVADDGSVTADFLPGGQHYDKIVSADIYVVCFGLNDASSGYHPEMTHAERFALFVADSERLVADLRARGGLVLLMTLSAVDWPTHYSFDRFRLVTYSQVYLDNAAAWGASVHDQHAVEAAEIAGGNWDWHIRANGTTFDNSEDANPPPPYDAEPANVWFTNIHYNPLGCQLVADQLSPILSSMLGI